MIPIFWDHFIISIICKAKFEGSIKRKLKFTNKIKRLLTLKLQTAAEISNHSKNSSKSQNVCVYYNTKLQLHVIEILKLHSN